MTHAQHIDALKRLNLTHTLALSTLTMARTDEEVAEAGALLDLVDLATKWATRARMRDAAKPVYGFSELS